MDEFVPAVRGIFENPMTHSEVEMKSLDLLQDIIRPDRVKIHISILFRALSN